MEHRRFYAALAGLTALCCGVAAAVNFAGMPAFESTQALAVSSVSALSSAGSSAAVSVPFASSAGAVASAVSLRESASSQASKAAASSASASVPVDVNNADAAALATLPGIGDVLAQRIIDYRAANGPFSSLDDLQKVSGIGEKKAAALAGLVTF